jgi:hypothetical protein
VAQPPKLFISFADLLRQTLLLICYAKLNGRPIARFPWRVVGEPVGRTFPRMMCSPCRHCSVTYPRVTPPTIANLSHLRPVAEVRCGANHTQGGPSAAN